jgi:hypothetical protein
MTDYLSRLSLSHGYPTYCRRANRSDSSAPLYSPHPSGPVFRTEVKDRYVTHSALTNRRSRPRSFSSGEALRHVRSGY